MTFRERLSNLQIIILRSLLKRGGHVRPVSLKSWMRRATVHLWRRGLIEIMLIRLRHTATKTYQI